MQTINFISLVLAGVFCSCSFVESEEELRVKRGVQLIEDVGRLVSGLYTELQNNKDEIKAEFQKELEEVRSAVESVSTHLDKARDSVSARHDQFDRKLQEITEQNRNNSKALDGIKASISLLDGKTQELTRTLGSVDVLKHIELQKNIITDLTQTIGSLLNLTVSTVRNETIQSQEILQCVNETLITTRRISELLMTQSGSLFNSTRTTRKPIVPEPDYFIQSSVFTDSSTGKRKVFLVPLQLDNRKGKWEQNRLLCRGEGAEMVMVHSHEENNFLHTFLRGNDIKMLPPGAWLGAKIINLDTNFIWNSGGKPNYVGVWAPGEPNEGGTSCLIIGYKIANNFWWNYPCADIATLMVCQMDLN